MKEWTGTNAANPPECDGNAFEEMLRTIADLKAKMVLYHDPTIRCGEFAYGRLVKRLPESLIVGEDGRGNPLFRVPIRDDPYVLRGMAMAQAADGQIVVLDLRTDEEKAEDERRFPR